MAGAAGFPHAHDSVPSGYDDVAIFMNDILIGRNAATSKNSYDGHQTTGSLFIVGFWEGKKKSNQ